MEPLLVDTHVEEEFHDDEACGLGREPVAEPGNKRSDQSRAVLLFICRPGPGRPDLHKISARHGILGFLQPSRA